jgi:hypothetical protein
LSSFHAEKKTGYDVFLATESCNHTLHPPQ